ncbi:hypothetical protein CEXT_329271, partial [Caerostris extrusa]
HLPLSGTYTAPTPVITGSEEAIHLARCPVTFSSLTTSCHRSLWGKGGRSIVFARLTCGHLQATAGQCHEDQGSLGHEESYARQTLGHDFQRQQDSVQRIKGVLDTMNHILDRH